MSDEPSRPSSLDSHPFLKVARELALEAGRRIMTLGKSPLVRERKPDHSIVTNADHEADRILRQGLRKAFPHHAILTEESGLEGPIDAEYMWVVDPLDGTRAFAKGVMGYSVLVGLLREGMPFAGVVYDPLEGHLLDAIQGGGTFHTFQNIRKQIHVSSRQDLEHMAAITSTGFPKSAEADLQHRLPGPWIPAVNSFGVKVGYLARQIVDIYVNHHSVHYWDTCAPQIILEEAGGLITFLDGTPLKYSFGAGDYQNRGPTLATNGSRHQDILEILRSLKPPLA